MMNRIRIKICGITSINDGSAAIAAGADAIGLVFCCDSRRHVDVELAAEIVASLPPLVMVVGVFLNPDNSDFDRVTARVPLGMLQFHGTEAPSECVAMSAGQPFIKALSATSLELAEQSRRYSAASALLVDTHQPGQLGGSGRSFDWQCLSTHRQLPLILAGGLNPANVPQAIRQSGVRAVDVSSGVENTPGQKNPEKINAFVKAVRKAEREDG